MKRFIFLLFFIACNHASGQPLHKPYAEQQSYLDSFKNVIYNVDLAEATDKINAAEKWASSHGDAALAGELEIIIDRKRFTSNLDSTIERSLEQLISSAEKNKFEFLEADALQAFGEYWRSIRKNSHGLENYVEAYNIYNKWTLAEFPQKQSYLYLLGGAYFGNEDYDNAIKYFREALNTKKIENTNLDLFNTIYNSIGLCYRNLNKYDTAEWYFQVLYDSAEKRKDIAWEGIAAGNIGNIFFHEKKYAEAIPMLEQDINLGLVTTQVKSAVGSMYVLSMVYFYQNDVNKSEELLKKALNISESSGFWPDYILEDEIYTQLSKVYAVKNDIRSAYLYADSALTAKDSVLAAHNALSIAKSQEKIDYINHKMETSKLAGEKSMQELIRNCLVACILMICIIGVLFINRQRLKQKKLEAEKKNAESDLDIAAMQLDNIRQSVQEKNKIIEHFTNEIERLKTGEEQQADNELLTQLESATILTDEQWENFRALFEKVHKGFFTSLKKKIPDLTPAEIRFLALTKLKLTSKEMASMLGISTNAIRIYRHRLRRKLDLDKEDMIEELVQSI